MSQGFALEKLSVGYGRRQVIEALSARELHPGDVVAVLGPNGSGKSTLLKAIAGLIPSHGEIRLAGQSLSAMDPEQRARHVVYLPQSLPPSVHLTVLESVLVAARAGRSGSATPEAVHAVLARLGIEGLAMRYLDELSGGQKQLAGLAQSLIREPEVLLLDEPLSALDLHHQWQVMSLVREETRRSRMVTLVVMHDITAALRHTDRVLLIHDGKLDGSGTPEAVITPASLARVYGVSGRVERCSRGTLSVLVDGLAA